MELLFNIDKQHISRIDKNRVAADSRNYLSARFSFSEEWDKLIKTAVFRHGSRIYCKVLENDICTVPWEVIASGIVYVSCFAGDRITTDIAKVYVSASGYAKGETPAEPTPDIYSQILDKINMLQSAQIDRQVIAEAVSEYMAEMEAGIPDAGQIESICAAYVEEHKSELKGEPGEKGQPGESYTITEKDYEAIAEIAAGKIAAITSTSIRAIEFVTEYPEVEEEGVLYVKAVQDEG